jgi:hypothetical protein
MNRMYWNQNLLCIDPLIKHVITVCIKSIIPIAKGCFICVNIVLDIIIIIIIINFFISRSSLIFENISFIFRQYIYIYIYTRI